MNMHVPSADTAPPAKVVLSEKITEEAVLAALGVSAETPLSSFGFPELFVFHDEVLRERARLKALSSDDQHAYADAAGEIYEQILKSSARTVSEGVLQLQAIIAASAADGLGGLSSICNDDELARIVSRLAELTSPPVSVDWTKYECELATTVRLFTSLNSKIQAGTEAMERWNRRNPWPVEPDYDSHAARIADFDRLSKAQSDHAIRYQNALRQCGRGKLQKQHNELMAKYDAQCERVAAIPARTLAEVKAKTKLAWYEREGGAIHQALIRDLAKCEA